MRRRVLRAPAAALAVAALVLPGCSDPGDGKRTAVASFYPLAYAARRILGPGWEVIDLTPPGTEAHDVELTLEARTAIEDADLVLYMGQIGFQPQIERAMQDASGEAITFDRRIGDLSRDPHIWLVPKIYFTAIADVIQTRMWEIDPDRQGDYSARAQDLFADLERLDARYDSGLHPAPGGVQSCRYQTAIVPHEALGWFEQIYQLRQFGLAGLTPEAEPTSDRLAEAQRLIENGDAGAVFYESTDDGSRRTAETLASDTGVPALPLSTLESEPPEGDYLSVMEDNLDSLREGLGCP